MSYAMVTMLVRNHDADILADDGMRYLLMSADFHAVAEVVAMLSVLVTFHLAYLDSLSTLFSGFFFRILQNF